MPNDPGINTLAEVRPSMYLQASRHRVYLFWITPDQSWLKILDTEARSDVSWCTSLKVWGTFHVLLTQRRSYAMILLDSRT